jgi:hypothetical protein
MLYAAVSSEVMILSWSWETYYFASSEESLSPSYARMTAGSSALAVRTLNSGGFALVSPTLLAACV